MSKYAVMFFNTELELGLSSKPNQWVNTGIVYTNNGTEALNIYAETPNPASQLIQAKDEDELKALVNEMKENFKNENWLNENLYPYL